MQPYELIVIGSGPGGQRAAIQAVKAGKRVALVEKHSAVGGGCRNTGTIPTQTSDHGGFEFPRAARDRKRSVRNWGPAETQWRGLDPWHRKIYRPAPHPRGKQQ